MQLLRTISAFGLALLVLVSSTSFRIGMHLCEGEIQNVAFFSQPEGCEMELKLPPCHRHTKAPCCADETMIQKGADYKASGEKIQLPPSASIDIQIPLVLLSELIPSAPASRTNYRHYDPPLRSCDLTVQHQVFLI